MRRIDNGFVKLSTIVNVTGPFAGSIRRAMGEAWIADTYERAADMSGSASVPVATLGGDLFRGPLLVSGGAREDARGILETKREIKDLRHRIAAGRDALLRLADETAGFEATIAHASNAIAGLHAEQHKQEKAIVGYEAQLQHAADESSRLGQKSEQLARERRQAQEERDSLDRRQAEARSSIERLDGEQRAADERLTAAQRRLCEAREAAQALNRRAADAGASHAALVERAAALAIEVERLEEASTELEQRFASLAGDVDAAECRIGDLQAAVAAGEAALGADVRQLETLRHALRAADDLVSGLRVKMDAQDITIKEERAALEMVRARAGELDVARARAESDLAHLAQSCVDSVQATLDEVLVEVAAQEESGDVTPDAAVICAEEPGEEGDGQQ